MIPTKKNGSCTFHDLFVCGNCVKSFHVPIEGPIDDIPRKEKKSILKKMEKGFKVERFKRPSPEEEAEVEAAAKCPHCKNTENNRYVPR